MENVMIHSGKVCLYNHTPCGHTSTHPVHSLSAAVHILNSIFFHRSAHRLIQQNKAVSKCCHFLIHLLLIPPESGLAVTWTIS